MKKRLLTPLFGNNNKAFATIVVALTIGAVALLLASSLQNQVYIFTSGLVRAKAMSEAQIVMEFFAKELRDAYVQASPVPGKLGATQTDWITNGGTYSKSTTAANFYAIPATGAVQNIYLYHVGNTICLDRPWNWSSISSNNRICIKIQSLPLDAIGDFLTYKDLKLNWKDYYVFFMHQIYNYLAIPNAVADMYNSSEPDPTNLINTSFAVVRNFTDQDFLEDYRNNRCGAGPLAADLINNTIDCVRFRFCLARYRSSCDSGNGNERFIIQTLVLKKTPQTVMGY